MELSKSFFSNFLINILGWQNNSTFRDYYINILQNDNYQAIKYTYNVILVLSYDINYWFEIEFNNKHNICIYICRIGEYILLYSHYNYLLYCLCSQFSKYNNHSYLKEFEKKLIFELNKINEVWNLILFDFKYKFNITNKIDEIWNVMSYDNIRINNNNDKHKYILSTISFLKNTYVKELNLYFNKNLISIIINYSLEPQNI